jgi:4-hydroxy-tetrahydrodipicolinate synthase
MARDDSIIGMKYSGSNFQKLMRVAQLAGDEFALLSGEEPFFPAQIALGARGGVLAIANLDPKPWAEMQGLVESGALAVALKNHHAYADLISAVYSEMNPVGLKAAMQLDGRIASGKVRLPLKDAKPSTIEWVQRALAQCRA